VNRSAACKRNVAADLHEWASDANNRVSDNGCLVAGGTERWPGLPVFLDSKKLRPPEPEAVGSNPALPAISCFFVNT
jgi:hypothetical protein